MSVKGTGGSSLNAALVLGATSGALVINALGDSIAAQSQYCPPTPVPLGVATWTASTAYAAKKVVQNGGIFYYTAAGGTSASSGGPTGTGGSINDGSVTWQYITTVQYKYSTSFLTELESNALGRVVWRMSDGYSGIPGGFVKAIVTNKGTNYSSSPTATCSGGATATVQTDGNGHVSGVTITNTSCLQASPYTITISDTTGSGATVSCVGAGSGTFAVSGAVTADMVAFLPDCVASAVDIFVVQGGKNDLNSVISLASVVTIYTQITTNLRTCYETLMSAGKKVVAMTLYPDANNSVLADICRNRVNNWIRDYCKKLPYANPAGLNNIVIAEVSGYFTDGTTGISNGLVKPIGGSGGSAIAFTQDGTHPNNRGASYIAAVLLSAIETWIGAVPAYGVRCYDASNGFDKVYNPGGNFLEALQWQSSTGYIVGQRVNNGGRIYLCSVGGTSAAGGGPTGTASSGIIDESVTWGYVLPAGTSVSGSATQTLASLAGSPPSGITYSGNIFSGLSGFYRPAGSAAGTITASVESPWSNGQPGQRQVLTFSLGSGGTDEWWTLFFNMPYTSFGLTASDLGVTPVYFEAEFELSALANFVGLDIRAVEDASTQNVWGVQSWTGAGEHGLQSTGEMIALPNSGKRIIRTEPMILDADLTSTIVPLIGFHWDASGAAGSATATIKMNHIALRRAYAA